MRPQSMHAPYADTPMRNLSGAKREGRRTEGRDMGPGAENERNMVHAHTHTYTQLAHTHIHTFDKEIHLCKWYFS